jgi:hypothetical protein
MQIDISIFILFFFQVILYSIIKLQIRAILQSSLYIINF